MFMQILQENSLSLATVPRERTSFSKREVNASRVCWYEIWGFSCTSETENSAAFWSLVQAWTNNLASFPGALTSNAPGCSSTHDSAWVRKSAGSPDTNLGSPANEKAIGGCDCGGWAADACCTSMSIGLDMVGFCSAWRRRKGSSNWERCLWWKIDTKRESEWKERREQAKQAQRSKLS